MRKPSKLQTETPSTSSTTDVRLPSEPPEASNYFDLPTQEWDLDTLIDDIVRDVSEPDGDETTVYARALNELRRVLDLSFALETKRQPTTAIPRMPA